MNDVTLVSSQATNIINRLPLSTTITHGAGESQQPNDKAIVLSWIIKIETCIEKYQRAYAGHDQGEEKRQSVKIEGQADTQRGDPIQFLFDDFLNLQLRH